jgi:hypothetical protein
MSSLSIPWSAKPAVVVVRAVRYHLGDRVILGGKRTVVNLVCREQEICGSNVLS